MGDGNLVEFPKKMGSAKDYKKRNSQKQTLKLEKYSKIIPPPGLPEDSDIQQTLNGQQRGEGSKPEWL